MLKKVFIAIVLFACNITETCYGNQTVSELIHRFRIENDIPGCAVGIYHDGKPQMFYDGISDKVTLQPVNADTLFEIGSITKSFTGILLASEVLQGWVALDTPLVDTIPALRGADGPIKAVTLKMLATHTSSFPRNVGDFHANNTSPEDIFQYLKAWQPSYPVGTHAVYSNIAFGILGYAVANVAGMEYMELLQQTILNPLGMHHTFLKVPPSMIKKYAQGYNIKGRIAPRWVVAQWGAGGGLKSTGPDMLKFLMANLGVAPEGDSLSLKLKEAMQFSHKGFYHLREYEYYGLGWKNVRIKGEKVIAKDGATPGFGSYILFLPEEKRGVVILCNRSKQGKQIRRLALKIMNLQTNQQGDFLKTNTK